VALGAQEMEDAAAGRGSDLSVLNWTGRISRF
jgi:hypothetical protein